MALHVWPHVEHIRYWRSLPRLSASVEGDDVPVVLAMVAAFGVVGLVAQNSSALRDLRQRIFLNGFRLMQLRVCPGAVPVVLLRGTCTSIEG
jgi:hypothetical protein